MKIRINDEVANVLERATWTFVQAFFSVVLVTNSDTWKSAAVAGLAAAFSVVKTYVVEKAKKMSAGTGEEEDAS